MVSASSAAGNGTQISYGDVAVDFDVLFSYNAATLCFCDGMKTRLHCV